MALQQKTIIWRFDDLCFDKQSKFYIPPSRIKEIATLFHKNKQHATFALIVRKEDVFSKESKDCINFILKHGHQILAHGAPHVNWKKLSQKEISNAIIEMRNNLTQIGIQTNVFVFPGLKTNPRAYQFLKKYGFNIILKGKRLKGLSKLADWWYHKQHSIRFFPFHTFATHTLDWKLKPVSSFYSTLSLQDGFIHVMDHLWLYKNESLKEFEQFITTTSTTARFVTIKEFLD